MPTFLDPEELLTIALGLAIIVQEIYSMQISAGNSAKFHAEDEMQWKRPKDLAKAAGWIWERFSEE